MSRLNCIATQNGIVFFLDLYNLLFFVSLFLNTGTREIAYVYAIRSAGIAFSVTQACSLGNLMGCGCDRKKSEGKQTPEGTWKWGGCSADVAFGIKFSRVFSDARELDEDARTLMNIHNHGVGRKVGNYNKL